MIILIHGTGDDNSKDENWIKWVAKIAARHGNKVLEIPGVASGEQDLIGTYVSQFMMKLPPAGTTIRQTPVNPGAATAELHTALRAADGQLVRALGVASGNEERALEELLSYKLLTPEAGMGTTGIKIRVAVVALCALAYYRRCRPADLREIRIIGHSRGGCVAVGVHNLLTYYSVPCEHTLTLDPCHGVNKPRRQKEYFHKIWYGSLTNIPCHKGVGADFATWATFRPPITVGDTGVANVSHPLGIQNQRGTVVANKLREIKHGHMGKLQKVTKPSWYHFGSYKKRKKQIRNDAKMAISMTMTELANAQRPNMAAHLTEMFQLGIRPGTSDYQDRLYIADQVMDVLG
jgi:hypothetical protein